MPLHAPGAIDVRDVTTYWDLLERRVAATPDTPFLMDEHDRVLTYAEFHALAERVAAGLLALGIGPGVVVSWQLPTRIDTVVVEFALARLGAVQNPIIPVYREREVTALTRQIGAEWLIVPGVWRDFDFRAMAATVGERLGRPLGVLATDDGLPEGDPATLPPPPVDAEAVRWLYSTSGTTSEPKAVRHTDRTLLLGSLGVTMALEPTLADVGSVAYPIAHIGGPLYLGITLSAGCGLVLLESFSPELATAVFTRHGVTMAGGSTAFYQAFVAQQRACAPERWVPSMRILAGGGAPMPPEVYFSVVEEIGIRVSHGYGMTECPMITTGAPHDTDEQLAHTEGAPVPGAEVRVCDPDGNALPAGATGEICIRGPMVCKGYVNAEATAAAFDADGFFHSGDLGHVRPDGHVVLTGRAKDMIIRKGENISPQEVEDVLHEHPDVAAAAVIGLPDAERGERVCAVVELRPGAAPLTLDDVAQHCRAAGLMVQKTPEQLEVVDALPRNATMKILKTELRDRYAG